MASILANSTFRGKTALERYDFSRPIRLAIRDQIITTESTVFDYGCGKGADVQFLIGMNISASGWDPHHFPSNQKAKAKIVNLGYVINVIEDPTERLHVLKDAFEHAEDCLIVAAQTDATTISKGQEFGDGILTSRNTFQKYYPAEELKAFLQEGTGVVPDQVDRGIYYLFKNSETRIRYLSHKYDSTRLLRLVSVPFNKERPSAPLGQRQLFYTRLNFSVEGQNLLSWMSARGRFPKEFEFDFKVFEELEVPKSAIEKWAQSNVEQTAFLRSREIRRKDLLILLALFKFDLRGRPKLNDFPNETQGDVKDFFGSYSEACKEADRLLFSVGNKEVILTALKDSQYGKRLPDSLYFHSSTLPFMSDVVQIFVGCAHALLGDLDGDYLIKISKSCESVSFLLYKDFEENPHPELKTSIKVNLYRRSVHYRNYAGTENPPILHRKETFLTPEHPRYSEYKIITEKEDSLGLLSRSDIGFKKAWEHLLNDCGIKLEDLFHPPTNQPELPSNRSSQN